MFYDSGVEPVHYSYVKSLDTSSRKHPSVVCVRQIAVPGEFIVQTDL